MPSLNRKSALSWSITNGMTVTNKNYRTFNVNWDINQINPIKNGNYVGAFQSDRQRIGGRYTMVNFSSELRGFTMASPTASKVPEFPLFQACGFELTHNQIAGDDTFFLTLGDLHFSGEGSGIVAPVDLAKFSDGKQWIAEDCVGDCTINFPALGIPTVDWNFKGSFTNPIAADALNYTFQAGKQPYAVGAGTVVVQNGDTYNSLVVRSISLALNNEIPDRPDVNATFGYADFAIVGREPIYTMVVELPYDVTDFNPEQLYLNEEQLTVTFKHGPAVGDGDNIAVEFDAYVDEMPVPSDDNGIMVYTIKMRQSIDSGAQALKFTFA